MDEQEHEKKAEDQERRRRRKTPEEKERLEKPAPHKNLYFSVFKKRVYLSAILIKPTLNDNKQLLLFTIGDRYDAVIDNR